MVAARSAVQISRTRCSAPCSSNIPAADNLTKPGRLRKGAPKRTGAGRPRHFVDDRFIGRQKGLGFVPDSRR